MLIIQSALEWEEDPGGIFAASSGDHSLDAKEVTRGQLAFHDVA